MSDRFQILSLDGGGIKGIFSAAILAAIEEDLSVHVVDHFDLITGTSTGGIIALGLGLGLSPSQMVDFYANKGPSIFANHFGVRSLLHWIYRKYPQQELLKALKDPYVFGEKKLGESTKRLVIPSYNLGEDDVYLFKTPHHERLKHDWKVPAWQVALATSAAPSYFPSSNHVDHIRHIDGGVWANNPTMVGIVETVSLLRIPLDKIHVLNLGTSDEICRRPARLNSGGKLAWANHAARLIMRGQSLCAHKQASLLLGADKILRLDPKVPDGLFTLDKSNMTRELLAKAAHESRQAMPVIEAGFMKHICEPYVPLYDLNKTNGNTEKENNHVY